MGLLNKNNIKNIQSKIIYAFAVGSIHIQNELKKIQKVQYITKSYWGVFITDDYRTYNEIQNVFEMGDTLSWWTGYVKGAKSISDAVDILKSCKDPAEKIIKIAGTSEV